MEANLTSRSNLDKIKWNLKCLRLWATINKTIGVVVHLLQIIYHQQRRKEIPKNWEEE